MKQKIIGKLKDELKNLDVICKQIWDQRYEDAKPQDVWYSGLLKNYMSCRERIKLLGELLEDED